MDAHRKNKPPFCQTRRQKTRYLSLISSTKRTKCWWWIRSRDGSSSEQEQLAQTFRHGVGPDILGLSVAMVAERKKGTPPCTLNWLSLGCKMQNCSRMRWKRELTRWRVLEPPDAVWCPPFWSPAIRFDAHVSSRKLRALVSSFLVLVALPAAAGPARVVGYYPGWAIYDRSFEVADLPGDKLTHLNNAFANLVTNPRSRVRVQNIHRLILK